MLQLTATQRPVLWALSEMVSASRTELAEAAGLSKAAVTAATRDLIAAGLIEETEQVRGMGRPSILLSLRAGRVWFAGLSLRPDRGRLVLCDITGRVAGMRVLPASRDPQEICAMLAGALDGLLAETGIDRADLHGVGISVSGVVNAAQDTCIRSTLMGWDEVPLGRMAAEAVGLPVRVENDANALVIREKLFGGTGEARSIALVDVADGIGGAFIFDRQLFRGFSGGAGELAHVTVDREGLPCSCGKRGCLDTLSSLRALRGAAQGAGLDGELDSGGEIDALERAAGAGNTAAIGLLHAAGDALGLAVAHVIQIVNPELVLIRLQAGITDGIYTAALRRAVDANVLPQMRSKTRLDIAPAPEAGHATGAASVAALAVLLAPR